MQAMYNKLLAASFSALTFDHHNTAVRGENIGHSRSGDPYMFPVRLSVRRVIHLRLHNALPKHTIS